MKDRQPHVVELLRSAALLPAARALNPRVGDWVVDATRGTPGMTYVGKLVAIELSDDHQPVYVVKPLGTDLAERWGNVEIRTVKPASHR